ncbi:hypothetical protein ACIP5Y_43265 [Nocardia sp. NPDC088792]|uniref:hypothetical protein n=1 Tax=Nocardia sp. NPDC088792 TaxID=3364332 RepID=UPI0037FA0472
MAHSMVQRGVTDHDGSGGRTAGALLIAVAGLVLVASFLTLATLNGPSYNHAVGLWSRFTSGNIVGISFAGCTVVAGVAGILLLTRPAARHRVVRWFGGFGAGMGFGLGAGIVINQIATVISLDSHFHYKLGAGFWLLVLVVPLSIGAAWASLSGIGRPSEPAAGGRAAGRVMGVFLLLAAILVIGGALFSAGEMRRGTISNWFQAMFDGRPFYLSGVLMILVGVCAIVLAMLLIAGGGARGRLLRMIGSVTVGTLFGLVLPSMLDDTFGRYGFNVDNLVHVGPGGWMLTFAVPVLFATTVASLVSNLETPGRQPVRPPVGAPAFAPQPNPVTFQQPFTPQPPRMARVYDGRDAEGRPAISRPQLNPNIRTALLAYLESAPMVLAARSFDADEFAPGERDVPLNFRTDGVWVWAGAVPHYLNKHGVPPEPELVQHIADRGYQIGQVDEPARQAAVRVITSA